MTNGPRQILHNILRVFSKVISIGTYSDLKNYKFKMILRSDLN